MTNTTRDETFKLFRHVRNGKDGETANLGGVTLFMEVNQTTEKIAFSVAICDDKENFNHKIAKNVAEGRYNAGQAEVGPYDRTKSLVDNVIEILSTTVGGAEYASSVPTTTIPHSQKVAALARLRTFTKRLPRATFTGKNVPKSVAPEAWPFPTSANVAREG